MKRELKHRESLQCKGFFNLFAPYEEGTETRNPFAVVIQFSMFAPYEEGTETLYRTTIRTGIEAFAPYEEGTEFESRKYCYL